MMLFKKNKKGPIRIYYGAEQLSKRETLQNY